VVQGRFWARLVSVSWAPGMTAPVESWTDPRTVAVWVWAQEAEAVASAIRAAEPRQDESLMIDTPQQ